MPLTDEQIKALRDKADGFIAELCTRVLAAEAALVEIRNLSVLPRGWTGLIAGSAVHVNPDEVLRRLQKAVSISEAALEEK